MNPARRDDVNEGIKNTRLIILDELNDGDGQDGQEGQEEQEGRRDNSGVDLRIGNVPLISDRVGDQDGDEEFVDVEQHPEESSTVLQSDILLLQQQRQQQRQQQQQQQRDMEGKRQDKRGMLGINNSSTLATGMGSGSVTGSVVDGANGLLLNLTLAGNSVGEAVYSVPLVIGHRGSNPWDQSPSSPSASSTLQTSKQSQSETTSVPSKSTSSSESHQSTTSTPPSFSGVLNETTSSERASSTNNGLFGTSVVGAYTQSQETSTTSSGITTSIQTNGAKRKRERSGEMKKSGSIWTKRAWDASLDYQTVNVQIDLGSSDMWIAGTTCGTSSCSGSGFTKFDAGRSLDSGVYTNLTYQTGFASGEVYWDEVQIGVTETTVVTSANGTGNGGQNGFDIAYQAMIVADTVQNEDLSGGQFAGILGLALPANSVISSQIPGSTSGQPDGATFLDNLFSSGTSAPQGRFFALSLERVGDTRTRSVLGIAMHDPSICGSPCTPNWLSLVSAASGPNYWRVILQGITATIWQTPGTSSTPPGNPKSSTISLPSSTATSQSWPVAVFDSGGSQILFGDRNLLNAVYGAWSIGPASDGNYYVPCTLELSLSFNFNGQTYAVHPLDMSDYTSNDASRTTCLGSMQYAAGLTAGDVIMGSSFLKNVYSVYTYPAAGSSSSTWAPQVGLVSLTNATQASQEFWNVRVLNQPLSTPSTTPSGGTNGKAANASTGRHVVSGGIIATAAVLGSLALAAGVFCAWYFWLRRKYGATGTVGGAAYSTSQDEDPSSAGAARRSKKFQSMQRQKSMVDGYSDFDVDSWADEGKTDSSSRQRTSTEDERQPHVESGESRQSSRSTRSGWDMPYPPLGWQDSPRRDKSPSTSTMRSILYSSPGGESLDPFAVAATSPTRKPLLPRANSAGSYTAVLLPALDTVGSRQANGDAYELKAMTAISPELMASPLEKHERRSDPGFMATARRTRTE